MKIHVLSDVHSEYSSFVPPQTGADVVVLAGDIGNRLDGLEWARQTFPRQQIVYICGNHEFWGAHWDFLPQQAAEKANQLGIHFLEDAIAEIGGVRFVGSSFWIDFDLLGQVYRPLAMRIANETQSDYREIAGNPKLTPEDVRSRHLKSRNFIATTLANRFAGETVVVTHHAPSTRSLTVKREWFHTSYVTNSDNLLGQAAIWIHGHLHCSCDYHVGRTRVICNARGRVEPGLGKIGNVQFNPGLVIEV